MTRWLEGIATPETEDAARRATEVKEMRLNMFMVYMEGGAVK